MDPSPEQQLEVLKSEHRRLDLEIRGIAEIGSGDQLYLARLKKRKLQLKDQIQLMIDRSIPDIIA